MMGVCYGSFWCEQVLFSDAFKVVAVVDWTDGAGSARFFMEDIDTAFHLSALDLDGIRAFVRGYQQEHPLPVKEWKALCGLLCYKHLASTNFLDAWLHNPYKDVQRWEIISRRWHEQVPRRFTERDQLETGILDVGLLR